MTDIERNGLTWHIHFGEVLTAAMCVSTVVIQLLETHSRMTTNLQEFRDRQSELSERMARLEARQQIVMHKIGIEPTEEIPPEH